MKASRLWTIALLAIFILYPSCGRADGQKGGRGVISHGGRAALGLGDVQEDIDYSDPEDFFTLNYTPQDTEGGGEVSPAIESGEKYIGDIKGGSTVQRNKKVKQLRALSDYKIKYSEKAPSAPIYSAGGGEGGNTGGGIDTGSETDAGSSGKPIAKGKDSGKPFTVCDWGPQVAIPSQVRFPAFYVLFSEPVVPLAAIGEEATASPYMTVSPAIKGVFRWKGTSLLVFDATEAADPLVEYTITVSDSIKSITGKALTGDRAFKTKAAPLNIKWIALGKSEDYGINMNDAPIAAAKHIRVCFNYAIAKDKIASLAEVAAVKGDKSEAAYSFTVNQDKIDTLSFDIKDDFPLNTDVLLRIKQPNGDKAIERRFHTLRPLSFVSYDAFASSGNKSNPVRLVFSHPLDENSVLDALSTKNDMAITRDNIEVNNNYVTVFGLPVKPRTKYTIVMASTIRDVWGQTLPQERETEISVPGMPSTARFLEGGAKMLEAKFPHRLVFEYQNAKPKSKFRLHATDKPLSVLDWNNRLKDDALDNDTEAVTLDVGKRDTRVLRVVELDDYLKNGRGTVRFDAAIKLEREPSPWDKATEWTATNSTTVQVTDIGITARFALNKVVAMVTSLSSGEALEGVTVNVYHKSAQHTVGVTECAASGVTDKNGLAVIALDKKADEVLYRDDKDDASDDSWYGSIIVEAVSGDDRALFVPDSHSSWRGGVEQAPLREAYKAVPRIFMFSDRGLYKPGETVSFRGIDREQKLGAFIPYTGGYTVELKSTSWRDDKVYAAVNGTVSEEGGFYGSFKVDGDITPGGYQLLYTRRSDEWIKAHTAAVKDDVEVEESKSEEREEGESERSVTGSVPITVSFFERARFQCSIEMPHTPIVVGEKIGASLTASYLAGGVLSGAEVKTRWYKEPWYFTTSDMAFKGYRFGPVLTGENRQIVESANGTLDSAGSLVLSCQTVEGLKGVPYRYRVSSDVLDESNQSISAVGVTVVHPSAYYIGVSGPDGVATFPKAGDKLNFKYKLATVEGKAAEQKALAMLDGNMTITLLRDEWNVVKQQGVSGYIYNRYEKKQVEESKETVKVALDGKVTVTALKPGNHTLRLSTKDTAGREIITETTFYATGSGIISWYSDDAASIRLTPDKARYTPGETATLLMESPLPKGDYLITVEREGIFTQEVRHFDGNVQTIDVKVARNFLPVAYISIASYSVRSGEPKHQYGEVDLDKPKGYYGVTPIFIDPKVKSFTVKVESSKKAFRPGEEAEVTLVATKGGKPLANAELTLMAVDRGVLDLVDYHVDDPISFFYNTYNFPLRVFGGDSRAYLMDPVTYAVNNLAGGDAMMKAMAADKMEERQDFNPTAAFIPAVKTDESGKAVCRFTLPDTLTTYRITAFGVRGELLALQEDEIAVQNPVNVQQVLPRRMRERDTAEVGVLVTNLDEEARKVSVSLSFTADGIEDIDGVTSRAGNAIVDGAAEKTVTVASGRSEMVCFDAAAMEQGTVKAVFTIKSDVLNERLIAPLIIEKPYIFETVTTTGAISGDEKKGAADEQVVIPSTADKGALTVTLDATRLGLLGGAVQYLFDYPYGCMEQQASKLLPLITFGEYIDVFGLDSQVTDIKKCVKSICKGWKQSQLPDGGFGYWPDARNSSIYVSTRVAEVIALALERGYNKKDLAIDIDALTTYIQDAARGGQEGAIDSYSRAYISYVLSLLGQKVEINKLSEICKGEETGISTLALSGMAALRQDDGKAFAEECAKRIRSFIRPTAQGADLTDPRGNILGFWCFYDGGSERLALAMQLFTLLDKDDAMIGRILYSLMAAQRSGYWQSTAQTARVLGAFYTLIKAQNIDATDLTATALLNKSEIAKAQFKGAAAKPFTITEDIEGSVLQSLPRGKLLPLDIEKKGRGNLYYTASLRYSINEERQTARDEGIGIVSTIRDNTTGEEVKAEKGKSSITLESGKTYRMTLDISTTYDRAYLALRAPIPSGAEILDASFVTTSDEARESRPKSDDEKARDEYEGTYYGGYHWLTQRVIRDNEVQFFYDRFGRGRDTVEFVFRATRSGVYPTPPVTAECMYEAEVFGRTCGTLFVIK